MKSHIYSVFLFVIVFSTLSFGGWWSKPAKTWRDSIFIEYPFRDNNERDSTLAIIRAFDTSSNVQLVPTLYKVNKEWLENRGLELDSAKAYRLGKGPKPKYCKQPEKDSLFILNIGDRTFDLVFEDYSIVTTTYVSGDSTTFKSISFYYGDPIWKCNIYFEKDFYNGDLYEFSPRWYIMGQYKKDLIYYLLVEPKIRKH